jgi:hypothetical protein
MSITLPLELGLRAGLWIRIGSTRIWIQHFSPIRIRVHKVIETGSNADPDQDQQQTVFGIKLKKTN